MKTELITTPNPLLRQKAAKVHVITDETHEIIAKMVQASIEWEKEHPHELSAAMAAPQIGELSRIIIIRDDMDDKENASFTPLINPEIRKLEGAIETEYEGCLSVPHIYGKVPRHNKVRIEALLEDGTPVRIKADGSLSRTLQHEIDHLNGVLFIDHIRDEKDAFYRLDEKGDLLPLDYSAIENNKDLFPDE
jgi:peptide deformylase